jgi:hypothetical protein
LLYLFFSHYPSYVSALVAEWYFAYVAMGWRFLLGGGVAFWGVVWVLLGLWVGAGGGGGGGLGGGAEGKG